MGAVQPSGVGDGVRGLLRGVAWRVRVLALVVGQPAASHSSTISPNVANRWRRGVGSLPAARNSSSSLSMASASERSTRETLRRDPSGKRTQAIHRCEVSFHVTFARGAVLTASSDHEVATEVATTPEGGHLVQPFWRGPEKFPVTWALWWRRGESNSRTSCMPCKRSTN
jgi:hypothetical protein